LKTGAALLRQSKKQSRLARVSTRNYDDRKQRAFQIRLPAPEAHSYSYRKVPWSTPTPPEASAKGGAAGAAADERSKGDASICFRLARGPMPTEGIPSSLLEALDQELVQFESFVRLTPVEVSARQQIVHVVQSTAVEKYSTAQIQPFGCVS
jgi:hypothetical protein